MQSLRVMLVSAYLIFVGLWLVLTRQVQAPGLRKMFRAFRPRYSGELSSYRLDEGYCWLAPVPEALLSDKEAASSLQLFEDGRPLGPAHATHADIRQLGRGRFSHWGAAVYFSTSDNSDPSANGRRYSVAERPHR
jgi:hypothetical protein